LRRRVEGEGGGERDREGRRRKLGGGW